MPTFAVTYTDGGTETVRSTLADKLAAEEQGYGNADKIMAAPTAYTSRIVHSALRRAHALNGGIPGYAEWLETVDDIEVADAAPPTQQAAPGA